MIKNNEYVLPSGVNKKPFETVYELKNEVPSFEEFMKTYESGTNYDDLDSSSVSEVKGYGPCSDYRCNCRCSSYKCVCNNYTKYRGGLIKGKRAIKISGKKAKIRGCQHLIHTGND